MKKPGLGGAGLEGSISQNDLLSLRPIKHKQPERLLHSTVNEHIALRAQAGTWWTHFPAGGKRNAITGALLKQLGTRAGVPDLLILCQGRLFGLELKNGSRGRLSPAQIATHQQMRA